MSIFGTVYYDRCADTRTCPEWMKSERYEYCDGFYEEATREKKGLFDAIVKLLCTVY